MTSTSMLRSERVKVFFLAMAYLLLVHVSLAQTKTYVGIKAGGHASSIYMEHTIFNLNINTGIIPGAHAGLLIKHFPKKKSSWLNSGIQLGVNYVQKGWKQTFVTDEPSYRAHMNYLELPLEGIAYFGGQTKCFATLGFYAEYLMGFDKGDDPNTENLGGADFYTYEASRDRETGYGVRTSGGVFRDFSFGSLHLEGYFAYSLSNVIDAGKIIDETPDLSNYWNIGISIAYLMPFGQLDLTK